MALVGLKGCKTVDKTQTNARWADSAGLVNLE